MLSKLIVAIFNVVKIRMKTETTSIEYRCVVVEHTSLDIEQIVLNTVSMEMYQHATSILGSVLSELTVGNID